MKKKPHIRKKLEHHCKICNKTVIGSSYKFRAHLYQHNAITSRFKCSDCPKEFFRSDAYKRHMMTHSGIYHKHHICDYCNRNFVDKRNLINHLKVHDDNHCLDAFKCMACGVTYCEERLLKYHIRREHFNLQENHVSHVQKQQNDRWLENVNKSAVIVEMTKIKDNVLTIKRHATIKTEVEIDRVNTNNQNVSLQTGNKSAFSKYMNCIIACEDTSQYSKAICHYCNKEMLKKSLNKHIRERHLKVKEYKCGNCGLAFSRRYRMVDHICKSLKRHKLNYYSDN